MAATPGASHNGEGDVPLEEYFPEVVKWHAAGQKSKHRAEAKKALAEWLALVVDWKFHFPDELDGAPDRLHPMDHLFPLDVGKVMKFIETEEQKRVANGQPRKYGRIPLMAECYLGDRQASSFVERVNSAAKLLLGDKRATLSDAELQMLSILRINRRFMEYMYANHAALLQTYKNPAHEPGSAYMPAWA